MENFFSFVVIPGELEEDEKEVWINRRDGSCLLNHEADNSYKAFVSIGQQLKDEDSDEDPKSLEALMEKVHEANRLHYDRAREEEERKYDHSSLCPPHSLDSTSVGNSYDDVHKKVGYEYRRSQYLKYCW